MTSSSGDDAKGILPATPHQLRLHVEVVCSVCERLRGGGKDSEQTT